MGVPAPSTVETTPSSSSQEIGIDSNGSMQLSLLSVLRGVDGLRGNRSQRIRVICLRAQCLLLVAFSRSPPDRLSPYLRAGGVVWKDILSLSDISSEAFAELDLGESTVSLSMVTLFLQVTLGLFENARGRRGPSLPPILAELGLSRNAVHDGGENSYAVPWVSIVIAATAGASGLFADVQQGQIDVDHRNNCKDKNNNEQLPHDHDVDGNISIPSSNHIHIIFYLPLVLTHIFTHILSPILVYIPTVRCPTGFGPLARGYHQS